MMRHCVTLFLTFLLLIDRPISCWANLPDESDCTTNGGPEFEATDLSSSALGELTQGGFDLTSNGTSVSPTTPISTVLGANISFALARQGTFQGYLIRVARKGATAANSFTFFLKDSLDVGTVSFCSALGLLNTSGISLSPFNSLTSAGFRLYFNGDGPFQVEMDIVITTTAPEDYEYYHSRYLINVEKPETATPSSSPSQTPSLSPISDAPTNLPTPALQQTTPPTMAPTKAPVTSNPSATPTAAPVTLEPTLLPTNQPTAPEPSNRPTLRATPEPSNRPTLRPSPTPVASTESPFTGSPTRKTESPTTAPMATIQSTDPPSTVPTSSSTSPPSLEPTTPVQTATFENLLLNFDNVPNLNADSLIAFVQETQEWYEGDVYDASSAGRKLQAVRGIDEFSTTINVRSQSTDDNGNSIAYDQSISYRQQAEGSSVEPLDIVLSPFEDDALVNLYLDRLRSSSQAFAGIPTDSVVAPDTSSMIVSDNDAVGPGEDSGSFLVVAVLGGIVVILIVVVVAIFVYRYKQSNKKGEAKSLVVEKEELSNSSPPPSEKNEKATAEIIIGDDEVSALYAPSVGAFSYDAEQSMSTVDYDYSKVANAGGNRSVVSSAGGTLGENTRGQDSQGTPTADRLGRWASTSMDSKLLDEDQNNYTVVAPAGKLGVVVDTPDEGAPVIHAVKDTSVLFGKVNVGDRLLAVDDEDVSAMTAVNISRLISKKSHAPVRNFTLRRTTPGSLDGPVAN